METVSVLAITRNGIGIASRLRESLPNCRVYAPAKLSDGTSGVSWYREDTPGKVGDLFRSSSALICIFSLGAAIRLIAPHMKSKKTDPAVLIIDDQANFVISALSGHIGGANELAAEVARSLGATPVVTTAADVNKTIPVDMVGRSLGWKIEDDSAVTRVSAIMVNEGRVGLLQEAGERDWWDGPLPGNVTAYSSLAELEGSDSEGYLIISDRLLDSPVLERSVVYRPKSLVVGIGLHRDTDPEKIGAGITDTLERFGLYQGSVARIASIKKPRDVEGLVRFGAKSGIPVQYIPREDLAGVSAPNPSGVVARFEGTPSVSEAAAILSSGGALVVEKQKFPPDLTVAVARIAP